MVLLLLALGGLLLRRSGSVPRACLNCMTSRKGFPMIFKPSYLLSVRWAIVAGAALVTAVFGGCGREPYSTVRISGTVTYEDGSLIPAPELIVYFEPQVESIDPRTTPRRGYAEVDVAHGTFSRVTTYAPGDGVIPGEHKVVIEAVGEGGMPDHSYFPSEYSDATTTPLTIEVGSQRTFDLQVPKPR